MPGNATTVPASGQHSSFFILHSPFCIPSATLGFGAESLWDSALEFPKGIGASFMETCMESYFRLSLRAASARRNRFTARRRGISVVAALSAAAAAAKRILAGSASPRAKLAA